MAISSCSQESRGDTLVIGSTLLKDISEEFFNHDLTMRLAIHLLDGIGQGSHAFVERMKCKARRPIALAKLVLEEWIKKKAMGATKAKLHDILEEANLLSQYKKKN